MIPTMLFRRSLITAALCGGSVWLCKCLSFSGVRWGRVHTHPGVDALIALCADLNPSPAIGKACLQALPERSSKELLRKSILGDIASADTLFPSQRAFAHVVRQRSREDFRSGRIVAVNGWIFSLTETRLYALASLSPQARQPPAAAEA